VGLCLSLAIATEGSRSST